MVALIQLIKNVTKWDIIFDHVHIKGSGRHDIIKFWCFGNVNTGTHCLEKMFLSGVSFKVIPCSRWQRLI